MYNIVEKENFFNVQTEKGVPLNNGHVGVGDWDYEVKKLWWSREDEPKPSYRDALNYISEDEDIVVDVEELAFNKVLVEDLLSNLTEREIEILKSRFGIGCKSQELKEVSERLPRYNGRGDIVGTGISKESVRRIESYALRKLKRTFVNT